MVDILILNKEVRPETAVVFLPGRGSSARKLASLYNCKNSLVIGLTPLKEWYPRPNGPDNQSEAILGLEESVRRLDQIIKDLEIKYSIKRTALVGFSAGAVVALKLGLNNRFSCIVCHSGAILEPDSVPFAVEYTPILMTHARDDDVFEWSERYLPARSVLRNKGYRVVTVESETGGHAVTRSQKEFGQEFVRMYSRFCNAKLRKSLI